MKLYNTLSKKIEEFRTLREINGENFAAGENLKQVGMYACGVTVYDYTHIGHLRKYVMDDVLVRVLRHAGYDVKHVQNITDVGHLVSDDDEGEDKMEKGARKYGQTAWELAKKFEDYFFYSMDLMGVLRPTLSCRATEHIQSQLEMVLDLERKGYTYVIEGDGVYFDTAKLATYGELSGHDPRHAPRETRLGEVAEKRNPSDFALWKFERTGEHRQMVWPSPWHPRSFPGWHVECSAMSIEHLGPQLDIHTGGIDHIAVHHANEIAQSEVYTGQKPFANFWVHHNFLRVNGEKMSKSLGNFYTIDDILAKGFAPEALRLLFLTSHYRSEQNFTLQSLAANQIAWQKLLRAYLTVKKNRPLENSGSDKNEEDDEKDQQLAKDLEEEFFSLVEDDLNTPAALTVIWKLLKTSLSNTYKYRLLLEFDRALGLGLVAKDEGDLPVDEENGLFKPQDLPTELQKLFKERELARSSKDFARADAIRAEFNQAGYELVDKAGSVLLRSLRVIN
jgi:cysteinyl-tRNA synthetase